MDTTATIVTGACAERWSFKSFFIFSIFVGGFIYPIFGCWVWGGGWLAQLGYRVGLGHGAVDYAGSGVVHLQGGALALITAFLIGPRIGKYNKDGKVNPILPHHIPMVQLGTFILAFGWFGFNAGSSLAGTDGRIGIVAVNTMIAGMSATIAGVLYMWWVARQARSRHDVQQHARRPGRDHRALRLRDAGRRVHHRRRRRRAGRSGASSSSTRSRSTIRSARSASTASTASGACSRSASSPTAPTARAGTASARRVPGHHGRGLKGVTGLFYGDAKQLVAQVVEVGVCIAWNVVVGGVIFFVIGKVLGSNRVSAEVEIAGLDIPEMGLPGYPEFITTRAPSDVPASEIAAAEAVLAATTTVGASHARRQRHVEGRNGLGRSALFCATALAHVIVSTS